VPVNQILAVLFCKAGQIMMRKI